MGDDEFIYFAFTYDVDGTAIEDGECVLGTLPTKAYEYMFKIPKNMFPPRLQDIPTLTMQQ